MPMTLTEIEARVQALMAEDPAWQLLRGEAYRARRRSLISAMNDAAGLNEAEKALQEWYMNRGSGLGWGPDRRGCGVVWHAALAWARAQKGVCGPG